MNTDTSPNLSQVRPVHPRAANRGWLARARSAGLVGGALLSFLALGLYASAEGEVMVSQVRLASDCGVTDRTIRNHVRRWERAGLLAGRTRCGPRGLSLYRLAAPDLDAAGVGPGRAHVPLEGRPGPARVGAPTAESERRAVGAPEPARPEPTGRPDRQRLLPSKTEGGREGASSLSPAVSRSHHPRAPWARAPRPLEPSPVPAPSAPRGGAYSPRGAAHPAAAVAAPARPLHGPATGPRPTDPGALSILRGALATLRAAALERSPGGLESPSRRPCARAETAGLLEPLEAPLEAPAEPLETPEGPRPIGELLPPLIRG